ncbi:hypothetical protein K8R32_00570, partial [bacterium]|nr:hypothetical protein [bacterium]
MKSRAMCLGGIFKGLQMAKPESAVWNTTNDVQSTFLQRYNDGVLADLPSLEEYLKGFATTDSAALIKWFADHNFPNIDINIPDG